MQAAESTTTADSQETQRALVHLALVATTLSLLAATPYFVAPLSKFRPWVSGEGIPIARRYEASQATGTQVAGIPVAPLPERDDTPPPPEQQRHHIGLQVSQEELAGITRVLEDPSGHALDSFYRSLVRTAKELPNAITRVAHYGDSSIASDRITFTVRRLLQQRFGDSGHGFVLPARGYMPYGHRDIDHRADGNWSIKQLVMGHLSDGLYGYGGVQVRTNRGASAYYGTSADGPVGRSVSRFEVWYQARPGGGVFEVRVDDTAPRSIDTNAAEVRSAFERIAIADGAHRLEISGKSGPQAHLYGVVLERDEPGVVYDSLGLVGARARRLLNYDPDHIRKQLEARQIALVILGFGGNEASDGSMRVADYQAEMERVIDRMHSTDAFSCLVMAPLDQGEVDERGNVRSMAPLPNIVEAQRRAAFAKGCAFFDTWNAMGGSDSMARWARTGLGGLDYRHATPAGYERIGILFYKALLKGYADYVEREITTSQP